MAKLLKVCFVHPGGDDSPAEPDHDVEARAVAERPDNVRVTPLASESRFFARAAVEILRLWDNDRTLRVRFLDGEAVVQEKIAAIAKEWEQHVNLRLEFVRDGAAEIRISFRDAGFSWSTVGTDALSRPRAAATMNYGWLKPNTAVREYRRVVLHEFGHALGMIHEHNNPDAAGRIPWDKPKVYDYYARQGWSREDVDHNLFAVYDRDQTNFTEFDPTSIMQYAVPDELTVGSFAIGWNTELSQHDKDFMRRQYPPRAPGTVDLEVGGPPHEADLSVGAEVDTYRFAVDEAATHILATGGATDVVMALHGPNDAGAVLAWDDDAGRGTNARIVRKLGPGEYWVTVRHKEPAGTGTYTVSVKRRRR
jgi:hypothetical protein